MNIRPRTQETCTCKAYHFPHREAGGKCHAAKSGPFCGDCGEPATPKEADFGIGAYEYWGSKGVDRDVQIVSTCCEAGLFDDASLTIEYDPQNDHDY